VRWSDLKSPQATTVQIKTDKALWIPVHPDLAAVIAARQDRRASLIERHTGKTVQRRPARETDARWRAAAGIPIGYSLHGRRKTLGKNSRGRRHDLGR